MNTWFNLDLGSRLTGWSRARKFERVGRTADRLFIESCADSLLADYMASLPLGDLPSIWQALSTHAGRQDPEVLEGAVRTAIARDWRQLSPTQIERAVDLYVCSLGRALLQPKLVPAQPAVSRGYVPA